MTGAASSVIDGQLLRVASSVDGSPLLLLDAWLQPPGGGQPRRFDIRIRSNPYGLRMVLIESIRLIECLRNEGETAWLPDTRQAAALAAAITVPDAGVGA